MVGAIRKGPDGADRRKVYHSALQLSPVTDPTMALPYELLIGLRYTRAKRRNHFISFYLRYFHARRRALASLR